jgi:hypothetical protein
MFSWFDTSTVLKTSCLAALFITNKAMKVHGMEGRNARQVQAHHDHSRHPEEEDVVARFHDLVCDVPWHAIRQWSSVGGR